MIIGLSWAMCWMIVNVAKYHDERDKREHEEHMFRLAHTEDKEEDEN